MKSFASVLVVASSAAVTTAQVTYDNATNTFICPADKPNGAFCSGGSLASNIIIRCTDGIGQPGNCNDNLAGYFPYGVNYSPCWETSTSSGDAACSKNCIVEGGSGNSGSTFTLPNCTPLVQSSTTSLLSSTSTPAPTGDGTTVVSGTTTITSTGTTICTTGGTTSTSTFTSTTTYCPTTTPASTHWTTYTYPPPSSVAIVPSGSVPSGTGSSGTGAPNPPTNGTSPTGGSGGSGGSGSGGSPGSESSPTNVPVGPSASPSQVVPGAASANQAGVAVAALGLVVAYFL